MSPSVKTAHAFESGAARHILAALRNVAIILIRSSGANGLAASLRTCAYHEDVSYRPCSINSTALSVWRNCSNVRSNSCSDALSGTQ